MVADTIQVQVCPSSSRFQTQRKTFKT